MLKCDTKGCKNKATMQQVYYPYELGCNDHVLSGVCVSVSSTL